MKKQRERLDKLLVDRGLVETRNKAQALIMGGVVYVQGEKVDKAGTSIDVESNLEVRNAKEEWVSRGAHKLIKALDVFPLDVNGKVCVDVGASTGGFTDVLLRRGASMVYSVDVGYGQLHWRLRQDSRVIVMERTNARYLEGASFSPAPEIGVMDASFISARLLLPAIESILPDGGAIISLIKPQFEAGRERIGKGGVVRSPEIHLEILVEVADFLREKTDLGLVGCSFSPIKGPKGNIEFLFYMVKGEVGKDIDLKGIVDEAHQDGLR
ncbi:TlyA family RNA methyltransferase [Dethiosulfovibrio salsuginis]|uniref:23S rRNA (Cytidine1920-2'-O)/16S rRNA (Cytidine1409-2'-O)-methyltransferase n=1 Tax=Dethiosulfovibrio salsuginis TaxID=561720 RepID=A0A1X7I303_9BACT|nr:TlyA family RNA methyltransferase [Dethiosulfovibrio salsuginis]SMG08778.1 23S rRNA (cytidine1920-2'-O)/16S rRNA (cytidine1409-2'-O)-methyltransferase [Dethiosulfovibrio salsuginis]